MQQINNINYEHQLHSEAGLIPAGKNEDDEQEWLGTDKEWNKYTHLFSETILAFEDQCDFE